MPTTSDFLTAAQWSAGLTLAIGILTALGFALSWGIRFRLVGATGFMAVLTVGIFALGLVPFTRTVVPGAVPFSRVFDNGATRAVITVPPTVTATELEATLKQAASDLFSPGRMSTGQRQLTIAARTVLHPQPGISEPLVLGKVERSLSAREDSDMEITLYRDRLLKLPKIVEPAAESDPV
ncbi:MAG: Ycf51 family protein [Cyanobacteria bacterium P01_A01_bin.135]